MCLTLIRNIPTTFTWNTTSIGNRRESNMKKRTRFVVKLARIVVNHSNWLVDAFTELGECHCSSIWKMVEITETHNRLEAVGGRQKWWILRSVEGSSTVGQYRPFERYSIAMRRPLEPIAHSSLSPRQIGTTSIWHRSVMPERPSLSLETHVILGGSSHHDPTGHWESPKV